MNDKYFSTLQDRYKLIGITVEAEHRINDARLVIKEIVDNTTIPKADKNIIYSFYDLDGKGAAKSLNVISYTSGMSPAKTRTSLNKICNNIAKEVKKYKPVKTEEYKPPTREVKPIKKKTVKKQIVKDEKPEVQPVRNSVEIKKELPRVNKPVKHRRNLVNSLDDMGLSVNAYSFLHSNMLYNNSRIKICKSIKNLFEKHKVDKFEDIVTYSLMKNINMELAIELDLWYKENK